MILFSLHQREFNEDVERIMAATGKSAAETLTQEGRLFTKEVIQLTPPFSQAPNTESFNVQRKTGEAAVERDIRRLFRVMDMAAIEKVKSAELKRGLKRAYRKKDLEGMKVLIRKALPNEASQILKVLEEADPRFHKQFRDNRGRIQSPKGKFWLLKEGALKRYITQTKKHVGKAKAGWFAAARALGVKLPNWITRHSSPGQFVDKRKDPTRPQITISNLVDYVQKSGADLRIVDRALQNRSRNLKDRLARIIASGWKKP